MQLLNPRLEGKVDQHDEAISSSSKRIDNVEVEIKSIKQDKTKESDNIIQMANELKFKEIAEMQAKENNVLIYNLQEPANLIVEAIDQKALDVNHLKEVFRVLEVDADLNNDLKFSARIGPFDLEADRLENSPRPLIIGFKEKLMKENILRAAKNLKN